MRCSREDLRRLADRRRFVTETSGWHRGANLRSPHGGKQFVRRAPLAGGGAGLDLRCLLRSVAAGRARSGGGDAGSGRLHPSPQRAPPVANAAADCVRMPHADAHAAWFAEPGGRQPAFRRGRRVNRGGCRSGNHSGAAAGRSGRASGNSCAERAQSGPATSCLVPWFCSRADVGGRGAPLVALVRRHRRVRPRRSASHAAKDARAIFTELSQPRSAEAAPAA